MCSLLSMCNEHRPMQSYVDSSTTMHIGLWGCEDLIHFNKVLNDQHESMFRHLMNLLLTEVFANICTTAIWSLITFCIFTAAS